MSQATNVPWIAPESQTSISFDALAAQWEATIAKVKTAAVEAERARLRQAVEPLIEDYLALLGDGVTTANEPDVLKVVRLALLTPTEK